MASQDEPRLFLRALAGFYRRVSPYSYGFMRFAAGTIVIVFLLQWPFGHFWTARGYEFVLLWALLSIAIFFKGGGRYSIDRLIGREF